MALNSKNKTENEAVPGFENTNEVSDNGDEEYTKRTKKTGSKKGGGFQAMGLSYPVLKGIIKRGYKIPTPIQRKTIPLVLENRDVVAMARTGSGKTACFLIPLFEKLKTRAAKAGARALILSPTRELALQTLRFIKDLGRYTGLKPAVVLGGDSMEAQFGAIHESPDIIVATPGRFLHLCVEMELKLNSIEYVVFDEADRLFEMGFGEQLHEIILRLPESRQTVLFSATLPKVLVEFARAGLGDPVLLRLDVESKLPDELSLAFLTCRPEQKIAVLLVLLKYIIPEKSQTVLFAATKHHVEYLHLILDRSGISNTYIYSDLDPSARKINVAKFITAKASVLVVTDVAARGIDIPLLDYVINFNFPAKSKLFVHRVGRCARAGRTGTAFSIVTTNEFAYVLDLHLFLGRTLNPIKKQCDSGDKECRIGSVPVNLLEEEHSQLLCWLKNDVDLINMQNVCNNAYGQYIRSRPVSSQDSNKRIKEFDLMDVGIHPVFESSCNAAQISMLDQMKNYRPPGTVFEIGTKTSSADYTVMKAKRVFHKNNIVQHHKKIEERNKKKAELEKESNDSLSKLENPSEAEVKSAFNKIIKPRKPNMDIIYQPKVKKRKTLKDEENYIPHFAPDRHTEDGLSVNFQQEANKAELDLTADSEETRRQSKQLMKWDRKKKKMVADNKFSKMGKIRTESGIWIPATYKSNRYAQWKEKSKVEDENRGSDNDEQVNNKYDSYPNTHWARHNQNMKLKTKERELKRPEQILKQRKIAEKKKNRQKKSKGKGKGKGKGKPRGKKGKH